MASALMPESVQTTEQNTVEQSDVRPDVTVFPKSAVSPQKTLSGPLQKSPGKIKLGGPRTLTRLRSGSDARGEAAERECTSVPRTPMTRGDPMWSSPAPSPPLPSPPSPILRPMSSSPRTPSRLKACMSTGASPACSSLDASTIRRIPTSPWTPEPTADLLDPDLNSDMKRSFEENEPDSNETTASRSSMEPLLASLSELSPPQVETIVRAGFDLLPADTKAALWTAFGPPGTAQVFDIDQKPPPQCGVKRPAAPKAEVCQELMARVQDLSCSLKCCCS